jgi:hypothetical protein
MRISKRGVICSLFLSVLANASAREQQAVFMATFEEVCLTDNGNLHDIRDWAERHHMKEVNGADARQVYTGSSEGGHAWWMQVNGTFFVIASRVPSSACAVFTSAADPAQLLHYIHQLPRTLSGKWPNVVAMPDKDESGPFGHRRGRAILFSTPNGDRTLLITSIFNDRPGGPYQATLQVSRTSAGQQQ